MNRLSLMLLLVSMTLSSFAEDIPVTVVNPVAESREAVPVVIPVDHAVRTALVTLNGIEVPCQLDDLNDDGLYDELCFLTDMKKKERQVFIVHTDTVGEPRSYTSRTFAFLSIRDRDKQAKQPKHLPIRSLSVPASSNSYQYVFPHGLLLESELIGFRIYGDHRQSVDLYGHKVKQLELSETMFYPTAAQKAANYGDDVLYTGSTYGCGTLQGWDGKKNVMYEDVRTRTFSVLTQGPVRSVVETVNKAWRMLPDSKPVDVTTRYILYAGHRDVEVDVQFSRPVPELTMSTGVVDLMSQNCEKISDSKGLLGCWGTALAGNNPKVYGEHTVGLAVCVPKDNFKGEAYFTDTPRELLGTIKDDGKPVTPNQAYAALVCTTTSHLNYSFTATADTETFGFADAKAWTDYLKQWKKMLANPVSITVK